MNVSLPGGQSSINTPSPNMFHCVTCGAIDHVLIDGYRFGEKLLEGTIFEVRKDMQGNLSLQLCEEDKDYFADLNQDKWLKVGEKFLKNLDIASCPICNDDVDVI